MVHSPFNTLKVLNDVFINSLEDNDNVYIQNDILKVPLRRHQNAVINEMKMYETNFLKGYVCDNNTLYSRYAILGDNVGVGKTLMVLSHIAQIKDQPRSMDYTQFHKDSSTQFYSLVKDTNHDLSNAGCLVIVPHTLFRQWNDEITSKTNLKLASIKTKKQLYCDEFLENVVQADIILISNTLYRELTVRTSTLKIRWNRIFIDEADSIQLSSSILNEMTTNFTWFITASFINLLFPQYSGIHVSSVVYDSFKAVNTISNELDVLMKTTYNNSYRDHLIPINIRSQKFLYNILNVNHILRGRLVIRCSKEFIDKSISLPKLITSIIRCRPSLSHRIVYDIINANVRQLLNAGDIKSALEQLGVKTEIWFLKL